jgi:hypothetical protein
MINLIPRMFIQNNSIDNNNYIPLIQNVIAQNKIITNNIQSLREQYSTDDQKNRHAMSLNEYIMIYQTYIFFLYYALIIVCFLYALYKRKLTLFSLMGILFFLTLPHILFFIEQILYFFLEKYFFF